MCKKGKAKQMSQRNYERKYVYRCAVLMSKAVSKAFCEAEGLKLPQNGHKKVHVEGAMKRLGWSQEKFSKIYYGFRKIFAGKDSKLVRFFREHRLTGKH